MKKYRIEFETEVPDKVTEEEVSRWAEFLLFGGGLPASHPLVDDDFDANFGSVMMLISAV